MHGGTGGLGGAPRAGWPGRCAGDSPASHSAWPGDARTGLDYLRPVAPGAGCAAGGRSRAVGPLARAPAGSERTAGREGAGAAVELPCDAAGVSRCRGARGPGAAAFCGRLWRAAFADGRGQAALSGIRGPAGPDSGPGRGANERSEGGKRAGCRVAVWAGAHAHVERKVFRGGVDRSRLGAGRGACACQIHRAGAAGRLPAGEGA